MKRKTTIKGLLLAALLMGGVSSAWGDDVTRTWDFTSGSWNTIVASTGTVYYATDGTAKTSTEYDTSTAVCMQVTSEFTYDSSKKYYQVAGVSGGISVTDNVPNKNYMSVKIPAGYTLKVTAALSTAQTGSSTSLILRVGSVYNYIRGGITDDQEIVYSNSSGETVTAYVYTSSTATSRYIRFKKIILTNTVDIKTTLTAISENTSWNFTDKPYSTTYDGKVFDNIFYGSGVNQGNNTALYLKGTNSTPTSNSDYTVQIKIPAKKAVGLLVNVGATNGRKGYLSDGTNQLKEFNADNSQKDQTISLASSESERTLYFFATNYDGSSNFIKYIYVYTQQSVNIGSTGWATLYTPCALDFSGVDGLTAYTATCSESIVTLTPVTNVQAGTGVVLKGTPNKDYEIPVAGSSSTDKGHLTGAFFTTTSYDAFTTNDYTIYGLASINNGTEVQFNPVVNGNIAAGKAFLKIANGASALARSLNVVFADEATGINTAKESQSTVGYYNLNGQRVEKPAKGLYIMNGKKVILK